MLTAAIYQDTPMGRERVAAEARDAAIKGLYTLGASVGGIVVSSTYFEAFPSEGNVVYAQYLSAERYDPSIDLHVYLTDRQIRSSTDLEPVEQAVVEGKLRVLGVSHMYSGTMIVNAALPLDWVHDVTVHEGAHSIGFVAAGAENQDPESQGHCADESCVMYKYLQTTGRGFCVCCSNEMKLLANDNVGFMTYNRTLHDSVSPKKMDVTAYRSLLRRYEAARAGRKPR